MAHWNGDEFRWRMTAPTSYPTIAVFDEADDVKAERDEKIKKGARVVAFGFSRVLEPELVEREPQLWEGD